MRKAFLVLAAAAFVVSAAGAQAARTYEQNVPYCENWLGTWTITKDNSSLTDNVTFDTLCKKGENDCLWGSDSIWWCQARGRRHSDNQTIMIGQVSMDPDNFGYYEIDNGTSLDSNTPYDSIALCSINIGCGTFTGNPGRNVTDDFGLKSGQKLGEFSNCTPGDNCTAPEDNCTLQKVIPSRIGKLYALALPVSFFILVANEETDFVRGDKASFDSDAIKPLLSLRFGKRLMLAVVLFRPLQLAPGEITVTVGDCSGAITVRGQE